MIINTKKERGSVLIITMIMILVMLIMSSSLFYSSSSTNGVSNNIALKQASILAAEKGLDEAMLWLTTNKGATLNNNSTANGYAAFAPDLPQNDSVPAIVDFNGFKTPNISSDDVVWKNGGSNIPGYSAKVLNTKIGGFNVAYTIHRMCTTQGSFQLTANISCATTAAANGQGSGEYAESSEYGSYKLGSSTKILYRITVRSWLPNVNSSDTYIQTTAFIDV